MAVTKYATLATAANWSTSTWGEAVASGVWVKTAATLTPASSPGWTINALAGLKIQINTELYTILSNTASIATMTASGGTADGTYTWYLFNETPPGDTDTADLNGAVVTMDIATIPASGTLALLRSGATNNSAGQLTLAMSGTNAYTINFTTIQGGTVGGILKITGTASGASVAINGTTIYGGTTTSALGLNITATAGTIVITSNITGGSATAANGMQCASGTTITIHGNVTGGTSITATGVYSPTSNTITLDGCLINSSAACAWYGRPPTWTTSAGVSNAQYCQWGSTKYGPEPTATQLLKGVICGDITGTLEQARGFKENNL